jgi:hypothetical protein
VLELAAAAASKSPSAWDEPGTLGFLVVFGMGIILFFVFRSLARHLRKINEAARLEALQAGSQEGSAQASEGKPEYPEPRNAFTRSEYERQQSEQNAVDLDF